MANLVLMPQIGISEESAVVAQWHVKAGDKVNVGDLLFSSETGKSAFDIQSEYAGEVLALLVTEGEEVLIKAPVCVIGQPGESYEVPSTGSGTEVVADAPNPQPTAPAAASAPAAAALVDASTAQPVQGTAGVSPRARTLAQKADVDPLLATPTGPEGRIIERDIRTLLESGVPVQAATSAPIAVAGAAVPAAPAAAYQDKPLSTMRKVIAKNMMASLASTAQLTHTASFDATAIQEYRKLCKGDEALSGITLTDMILFAVTRTLPQFPALNAWLMEDTLRLFGDVNLACAVDTEKGLMVPVINGASRMSLLQISQGLKAVAAACKDGTIAPELLTGGSFTVSNVGMYGIESFTPILNAPQTGLLGVNTITQRPREVDGQIALYPCMTLSLTYDHRAVDGAPASRFLQALCKNLERFPALLAM